MMHQKQKRCKYDRKKLVKCVRENPLLMESMFVVTITQLTERKIDETKIGYKALALVFINLLRGSVCECITVMGGDQG